jgi:uncharacterized membrane protein
VKKIAKRALSGLLAVIMVVSLLCVGAQAETITEKSSDNSTSLNAQSINLGDEINGKISEKGDVDFYKFTLTEEGCVTFKITSYVQFYSLIIYDTNGDQVWKSLSNEYNSVVGYITNTYSIDLASGTYYLSVDGEHHGVINAYRYFTGNYMIQTSFISANTNEMEGNNSVTDATPITFGSEIRGQIALNDTSDFYTFTLTESGEVTIDFTSYIEYYSIFIYDLDGNEVWVSQNNPYNSVVGYISNTHKIDLTSGVYFVKVDGQRYGVIIDYRYHTGNYTFQTSFVPAKTNETEPNNSTATANPITLNYEIHGQIAINDSEDYFSFTLAESRSIVLNITSYIQWTSVFLYTEDGNEVWSSQNKEYNASIGYLQNTKKIDLNAGLYYLKVSRSKKSSTGNYTLWLNAYCTSDADHIWNGGEVTTQPTTTTTGVKTYTCTVCGETKTEEIAKLPASDTNSSATTTFTDVPSSQYYYDPVYWAVGKGITNGTGGSSFSPNANCTRGQIVTFLWRAAGEPEPTTTVNPFTDVSEKDYYYKAVLWAYENGITTGATSTTFNPKGNCTRGQIVTFLWRYANKPTANASGAFSDVKTGEYYTSAVYWAVANGITNGMSSTTFVPGGTCTRGQAVTFLYRYAK